MDKFCGSEVEFFQILDQLIRSLNIEPRKSSLWGTDYILNGEVVASYVCSPRHYQPLWWINRDLVQRKFDFRRTRPLRTTEAQILNRRFFNDCDHDITLLPEVEKWYYEFKNLYGRPKNRLGVGSVNFQYLETAFPAGV